MTKRSNIIDCYNKTAENYAAKFGDELSKKHFDTIILQAFLAENIHAGKMLDLGCGPGQTTRFMHDAGCTNIIGIDISPAMIETAARLNPGIAFETGDMLNLNYPDESIGSAIASYSVVHFSETELKNCLREIRRVLKTKGQFLFSFHIGKDPIHMTEFLGQEVDIDFIFFETTQVVELLSDVGFHAIDLMQRAPYPGVEYPSQRAYFWVEKK